MADRKLDPDRQVALEQLPRELRPAFSALWKLDLAFADVVATSSEPRIGAIRLAWWREQLEALDDGLAAPAEPRLMAVAEELLPRGITGKELSHLEGAWLPLLGPFPWGEMQVEGMRLRGRILFGIGARLLGVKPEDGEAAGAVWSLVDAERHCSDPASREALSRSAREGIARHGARIPRQLRPLTVLAALAAADLVRAGAGLARLSAAVRHRLWGSIPL